MVVVVELELEWHIFYYLSIYVVLGSVAAAS
jgi:hypothetical protein